MSGDIKGRRGRYSLLTWAIVIGVLGLLLIVVIMFTGSRLQKFSPNFSRRGGKPIPVTLGQVVSRNVVEAVGATSTTFPYREVEVRTEVQGRVLEIPVKAGEVVTPQTLVVQLDDKEYRTSLKQAEAALESAQVQLKIAHNEYERYQYLHQQRLIPLAELEKYLQTYMTARATQAQALNDVTLAQIKLKATKIYSPVTGVFSGEIVHPGEYVQQASPMVSLAQITPIFVQAKVPEEKIMAVYVGQEATVTFDAFPGQTFEGKVVKIDPKTDPSTRVFSAYVELANQEAIIRLGLTGYTRMHHKMQGLVVPSIALINLYNEPTIFVVKDNIVHLRHVSIAGSAAGQTLIKDGLTEGEEVVIAGQRYLKEGDTVKGVRP